MLFWERVCVNKNWKVSKLFTVKIFVDLDFLLIEESLIWIPCRCKKIYTQQITTNQMI